MISDIFAIKFLASVWFTWWLGMTLILMRDDSHSIVADLLRMIKHGGLLALLSSIAIFLIVPLSIPFSIAYLMNKWMRKR
jgi:hypothetical protein